VTYRVVVAGIDLVIEPPEVVEGVGLLPDGETLVRAGGGDTASALGSALTLVAEKEVHLVPHDRAADGAAVLGLARIRFLEILLFDEEVPGSHRRVGKVSDHTAAPRVGSLLGDCVDDPGC